MKGVGERLVWNRADGEKKSTKGMAWGFCTRVKGKDAP